MRIVGLDLSLASTGVGIIDNTRVWVARIRPGQLRGHERLAYMCEHVHQFAAGADLIVAEGASYGSPNRAFDLGGGWWVVMHHLYERGLRDVAVVAPSTLKVYACGSAGSAKNPVSKDAVVAAVARRYTQVEVTGNDQADGLVLAAMGADQAGWPIAPVPATHRRALTAVRWPAGMARPTGLPRVEGTLY